MIITDEEIMSYEDGLDKRLTINGITKVYKSKRVPINKLFYNDMNGRIATYGHAIKEDFKNLDLETLTADKLNEYNDRVGELIIDSAGDKGLSYNNTRKDIFKKGQLNPGVILDDGRIIDGNRRFTAIRQLYRDESDPRFAYFEAVIIPTKNKDKTSKEFWKVIKELELNLQFDVDEKKGYNKIDMLVSFYNDVMNEETKLLDEKEYCFHANMTPSKFKENKNIVNTMLDYLNWRNAPKAFYLLKKEKLDGPIEELSKKANKMTEEEWNQKKNYIYEYITFANKGDVTRVVRQLLTSAQEDSVFFNTFKEELKASETQVLVAKTMQKLDKKDETPEDSIAKEHNKNKVMNLVMKAVQNADYQSSISKANAEPLEKISKARKTISTIDKHVIKTIPSEDKTNLIAEIKKLKDTLTELEGLILNESSK